MAISNVTWKLKACWFNCILKLSRKFIIILLRKTSYCHLTVTIIPRFQIPFYISYFSLHQRFWSNALQLIFKLRNNVMSLHLSSPTSDLHWCILWWMYVRDCLKFYSWVFLILHWVMITTFSVCSAKYI